MRAFRLRAPWVVVVGLAGSQAGHLLVYGLRFGRRAAAVQGTAVHSYFPTLAAAAFAAAGAGFIVALAVVGAARLATRAGPGRRAIRPSIVDLLSILFTLQLAIFVVQETLEWTSGGAPLQPATVVWGIAGQLPAALAAAVALSLLGARFEAALTALARPARQPWHGPPLTVPRRRTAARDDRDRALVQAGAVSGRGPPAARL